MAECKQFGVCIIGDDLFETELYFITFDEDEKEKKQFKIVNDVFHCSRRSLHWLSIGMETVSFCIIYDDLFDCRVHIAMIKGQVMVNCNIMLKTKNI